MQNEWMCRFLIWCFSPFWNSLPEAAPLPWLGLGCVLQWVCWMLLECLSSTGQPLVLAHSCCPCRPRPPAPKPWQMHPSTSGWNALCWVTHTQADCDKSTSGTKPEVTWIPMCLSHMGYFCLRFWNWVCAKVFQLLFSPQTKFFK